MDRNDDQYKEQEDQHRAADVDESYKGLDVWNDYINSKFPPMSSTATSTYTSSAPSSPAAVVIDDGYFHRQPRSQQIATATATILTTSDSYYQELAERVDIVRASCIALAQDALKRLGPSTLGEIVADLDMRFGTKFRNEKMSSQRLRNTIFNSGCFKTETVNIKFCYSPIEKKCERMTSILRSSDERYRLDPMLYATDERAGRVGIESLSMQECAKIVEFRHELRHPLSSRKEKNNTPSQEKRRRYASERVSSSAAPNRHTSSDASSSSQQSHRRDAPSPRASPSRLLLDESTASSSSSQTTSERRRKRAAAPCHSTSSSTSPDKLKKECRELKAKLEAYERIFKDGNLKFCDRTGSLEFRVGADSKIRRIVGTSPNMRIALTTTGNREALGAKLLNDGEAKWRDTWDAEKRRVRLEVDVEDDLEQLLD